MDGPMEEALLMSLGEDFFLVSQRSFRHISLAFPVSFRLRQFLLLFCPGARSDRTEKPVSANEQCNNLDKGDRDSESERIPTW